LVQVLLGEPWLATVGPLTVLGLWGAIRPVEGAATWLLNGLGSARNVGAVTGLTLLVAVPVMVIAATLQGLTAVAWVLVGQSVALLAILSVLAQRGGVPLADQWRTIRSSVAGCIGAWISARAIAETQIGGPGTTLALALGIGIAVHVVALVLIDRGATAGAVTSLRSAVRLRRAT
jgi:O-antigen/teichoic acid export membrane protein